MSEFAFELFIFSIGAFFIPICSRYLRIPAIVGEIFYGIILHSIFSDIQINTNIIEFFSEMGFWFIMFLAGLELNFDKVNRNTLRSPLFIVLIYFLASIIFWNFTDYPPFYILGFTATSVGIVFIGLKNEDASKTKLGEKIIWVATLGEIFSIMGVIGYEALHKNAGKLNLETALELSQVFILIFTAYLAIRIILMLFWFFPKAAIIVGEKGGTSEMGVRLAFLVLLSMVAASALLHIELILGAFLGGMIMAFVFRDKEFIEEKLSSIGYGFFIPFFFIKLGWDFFDDTSDLKNVTIDGIKLYGILLFVRFLGALLITSNIPQKIQKIRHALAATFLWASPLTLLVAISELGKDMHAITQAQAKSFLVCAILGGILGPTFFSLLYSSKTKNFSKNNAN